MVSFVLYVFCYKKNNIREIFRIEGYKFLDWKVIIKWIERKFI